MKEKAKNAASEHYRRLRVLSCEELWRDEVPRFERLSGRERVSGVAVVRAVGVVFSEQGTPQEQESARSWLRGLLQDPEEKVRRYAMAALPKLGADAREEKDVLTVLRRSESDREKKFAGRALEKIGGSATLQALAGGDVVVPASVQRRASANVARQETPGALRWETRVRLPRGQQIFLHCRSGLEGLLEEELHARCAGSFRVGYRGHGILAVEVLTDFSLQDLYTLRCFASAGFFLGTVRAGKNGDVAPALARLLTSPAVRELMEAFTDGPVRFRLEFASKGHQRALVRRVGDLIYERCPALLNDSRHALWQVNVTESVRGSEVELCPRFRPDPRFAYRLGDVPAASHPPLAAAMVRLADLRQRERVWDPFCGSGLELIECAKWGGVEGVVGTDRSESALETARANFVSAGFGALPAVFACCDFRNRASIEGLSGLTAIVTNPPMGRRVPIPDLDQLIEDLFQAAAELLVPGGRIVLANPLPVRPQGRALQLEYQQKIDLGGFHVRLEKYTKRR